MGLLIGAGIINPLDGTGIADIAFSHSDTGGNNVYKIVLTNEQSYNITVPKGDTGEGSYIRATATHIQWKTGESGEWQNLVTLSELKGDKGDIPIIGENGNWFISGADTGIRADAVSIDDIELDRTETNGDKVYKISLTDGSVKYFVSPIGDTGNPAPYTQIQYSTNGTSWHFPYVDGDVYYRESRDGGVTWDGVIPLQPSSGGGVSDTAQMRLTNPATESLSGDEEYQSEANTGFVQKFGEMDAKLQQIDTALGEKADNEQTLSSPAATDTPTTAKSTITVLLQNLSNRIKALLDRFHATSGHKHNGTDSPKVAYSDLSETPTIPTVNDAALTVTQNGVTVGNNFTANSDTPRSYAIVAPDWNAAANAQGEIKNKPEIDFTETTITVSSGVGTIAALTDKTIYRFSAAVSQLVISATAGGWTANSMAQLVFTWATSLNSTPINYSTSGVSAFDDTEPSPNSYCEITIFNNKARINNGQ